MTFFVLTPSTQSISLEFNQQFKPATPHTHYRMAGVGLAPAEDEPLRPLLAAVPSGTLVLLERTDCSGAFLLPLLVRAALDDGHRVRVVVWLAVASYCCCALCRVAAVLLTWQKNAPPTNRSSS